MSEVNAATAVMNGGSTAVREDDALLLSSSAFNSDDEISFNNNAVAVVAAAAADDAAGEEAGKKMPNDDDDGCNPSKTIAAYGNTQHHHRSSSSPPPTAPSSSQHVSSSYPYEAAAAPPSNHRHYHPPNGRYSSSSSHHNHPSYGYHYPPTTHHHHSGGYPPNHPYSGHHHTSSYHHPHYHHHGSGGYYPPPLPYHPHYPPPPPHHHHHGGYHPIHHGAPAQHHRGSGSYPPSATRHSHPPPPPSTTAGPAAASGLKSGNQVDTAANSSSKINGGGVKDVAMSPHGDTSNTTKVNADTRGENGMKEVNMITPGDMYISKGMRQGLLPLNHHKDATSASDVGVSSVAAKAANAAAKLVSGGSYYTHSNNNSSSNTFNTPATNEQLVQQLKRDMKKSQQENSVRVADIASVDAPLFGTTPLSSTTFNTNPNTTTSNNSNNSKAIKKSQKRYKDKDGFIYYRRVGKTRNYKKLFERGLVPKGTDGTVEIDKVKVMERVNAIQTIIREPDAVVDRSGGKVFGGGDVKTTAQDDEVVHDKDVVPPQNETAAADGGGDDVREDKEEATESLSRREMAAPAEKEDDEESSPQLPIPPPPSKSRRPTQFLYSHQQNSLSGLDGYELQVVHHADGNDFTVEVVQPAGGAGKKPLNTAVEDVSALKSSSSLTSVESRKADDEKSEEVSKKNGDFVNAVDSILDAAETIAKRSSPNTSVVTATPQAQYRPDDTFYLPGISYSTKRKCADMIKGYQEKRQRSNSIAFSPPSDYPSSSPYAFPAQVRPSPQDTARVVIPAPSPPNHYSVVGPSPPGPSPQNAYSQITCQDRKEKRGERTYCYPHPSVDLAEYYSSRQVSKTDKEELAALAICAATHIQKEPVLFRAVLLRMAIERERDSLNRPGGAPSHLKSLALKKISPRPDSPYDPWSDRDESGRKLIRDGFFWNDYPCLEKVLQKYMMEYYFMSENRPQSKKQQQFNNRLVCLVFQEAISRGYLFDPVTFSLDDEISQDWHLEGGLTQDCAGNWVIPPGFNHKKLRDRIRCYYKTHVQNSKKRLGTLLKNPMKERNRDTLLRLVNELKSQEHVELSPECVVALKRLKAEQDSIRGTVSTPSPNSTARNTATLVWSQGSSSVGEPRSHHCSHGFTTTTTPHSSRRAHISDGGSGGSSSASSSVHSSVQTPHHQKYVSGNAFSPFKHASLLSSMRQLDSQRH